MAEGGVILSGRIEADDPASNAGTQAQIAVADRQGRLLA